MEKVAPIKFKGNIEKTPLSQIIDYISFSCILHIEKKNDIGVLFFKNGKLINARLNNEFDIEKSKDILKWSEGEFCYQKWTTDFEIEHKYLSDVLYFIEFSGSNAEISFIFDNKFVKIFFSEGTIVNIEPNPKDIKLFFKDILKESKGIIRVQNKGGQTGDLKEYFSELIISDNKIKTSQIVNKKAHKTSSDITVLDNKSIINISIIEDLFNNLQNDLGDQFIAGSFYSINTENIIYKYNTDSELSSLFFKLHKTNLIIEKKLGQIKDFYLFDLRRNKILLILTFKEHHFGLVFTNNIKLGYLFNIAKPLIDYQYNKYLTQKF